MPIVMPPPADPPMDVSTEITVNRSLTHQFIMSDPTQIVLIPHVRERKPSGGQALVAQTPRDIQVFRLIPMSHTEQPATSTSSAAAADAGVQRRYKYTIMGEWNCLMEVNDRWTNPDGQEYVIDNFVSDNSYERKALVTSYGGHPTHG